MPEYADADENLIHIIQIKMALFPIRSAQNIIIAHPTGFYPSSGMKNRSPESQYFGQKKLIFFYY